MCDALCAPLEKALDELELRDHDEDEQQRHEDTVRDAEFGGEDIEAIAGAAVVEDHMPCRRASEQEEEPQSGEEECAKPQGVDRLQRLRVDQAVDEPPQHGLQPLLRNALPEQLGPNRRHDRT